MVSTLMAIAVITSSIGWYHVIEWRQFLKQARSEHRADVSEQNEEDICPTSDSKRGCGRRDQ